MKHNMNICLSSNEKFAELCTIAMLSVAMHTQPSIDLRFYVIDNDILPETNKKMQESLRPYSVTLTFLNGIDVEKLIGSKIDTGAWTLSTLQRLFICGLFPETVDRVLYLDCDILVRNSLEELYNVPLDGYYGAGVSDCTSNIVRHNIGLTDDADYINGGVLLINLEEWRNNTVEKQFVRFFKEHLGHLQYFDQDIINGVLSGKVIMLHPKYNVMTAMYNYSWNEIKFYHDCTVYHTEEQYEEAVQTPVIVHFSTDALSVRPWYENGGHPFRNEWMEVRGSTVWAKESLWKNNEALMKKLKRNIFCLLPKDIALRIARVLHRKHSLKFKE